jgi:hypothetical protein
LFSGITALYGTCVPNLLVAGKEECDFNSKGNTCVILADSVHSTVMPSSEEFDAVKMVTSWELISETDRNELWLHSYKVGHLFGAILTCGSISLETQKVMAVGLGRSLESVNEAYLVIHVLAAYY